MTYVFVSDSRREVLVRIFACHSALSLPAFRYSESMPRRDVLCAGHGHGQRPDSGDVEGKEDEMRQPPYVYYDRVD